MKDYITYRIITEYVIPIAFFMLIFIACIIWALISGYKESTKAKYMKQHGYERYLRSVASVGDKVWYAYRKDNVSVDEDKLFRMKMKDIKQQFK